MRLPRAGVQAGGSALVPSDTCAFRWLAVRGGQRASFFWSPFPLPHCNRSILRRSFWAGQAGSSSGRVLLCAGQNSGSTASKWSSWLVKSWRVSRSPAYRGTQLCTFHHQAGCSSTMGYTEFGQSLKSLKPVLKKKKKIKNHCFNFSFSSSFPYPSLSPSLKTSTCKVLREQSWLFPMKDWIPW